MKNNITILLLLLATMFMMSCEEEVEDFNGPYRLAIIGATTVAPETTKEYSLQRLENDDSYTWAIEGPATIVSDPSGTNVSVSYQSIGHVTLTVTNGGNSSGRIDITVAKVPPAVTASFGKDNHGVLKGGDSDTVFFKFDSPLEAMPTFAVNADSSGFIPKTLAFESGTLGPLQEVKGKYFAIYTAGEGNGTPEALFQDIKTTDIYGGINIDSAFVQLYRVDNIVPVADLSYSHTKVNDSTVVTVTATFTEPVVFDFTQPVLDSAMYVSFSGGGVKAEKDTLKPTADPLVYTYEYTVNGEGTGPINVTLENVVDLAGHQLAAINNQDQLVVDNLSPTIIGIATDEGARTAAISLQSTEDGTGYYLILNAEEEAPEGESSEEFAGGVASGSWPLTAGEQEEVTKLLAPGDYNVYFMAADEAGNYSDVQTQSLTVTD